MLLKKLTVCVLALMTCYCELTQSHQSTNAASPSFEDVSAAVAAASSGDTVTVPAGVATWYHQLVVTKGIKIIGAGAESTKIISGYTPASPYNSAGYLIAYTPESPEKNEPFRISGFSFDLADKCQWLTIVNHSASPINKIRVDHNKVTNPSSRMITVTGAVYGVIDNNTLSGGILLSAYGMNSLAWNNFTFNFGTADNLYFEDNTCTVYTTPHDGGAGGRYCTRHNTYIWTDQTQNFGPWNDMHGNMGMGQNFSGFGVEIYENTMQAGSRTGCVADLRGGKGLVYNNTIQTSSRSDPIQKVREEYVDSENPPAVSHASGQPQHVSDTYFWGNNQNGAGIYSTLVGGTIFYSGLGRDVPMEDKDFWTENPSFDGSSGVGVGPLSNRPATAQPGVAYWATDTQILYRWTKNGGWEEFYTPYAYPHPLRKMF